MFLKKKYKQLYLVFYFLVTFFFQNTVFCSVDIVKNPMSELSQKIYQMVVDIHKKINQTIEAYVSNIAAATVLLDEIDRDLKKIVFEEQTNGIYDLLPTDQADALLQLIDAETYPEWVKVVQMTSPTIKVIKVTHDNGIICYAAYLSNKKDEKFVLKEGDHNVWIESCTLYGYDKIGNFFIQKYDGDRCST